MASNFLLGLCPKCLEKQVSKCLLAAAPRTRRITEAHVMLYQISDHQKGILLDNRYALNKAWKDMWVHHVGGKFAYCLTLFDVPVYNLTQFTTPLAPI
jgi:hypothetical protein